MPKFKTEHAKEDGWSDWVYPIMNGYKMACCDCGLVHDMKFLAVRVDKKLPDGSWEYTELDPEKHRVIMKAKRNNQSTRQMRRRKTNSAGPCGPIKKETPNLIL